MTAEVTEPIEQAMARLGRPSGWSDWYVLCAHCDHFVVENDGWQDYPGTAPFTHLDDGEKEHDHDPWPANTLNMSHGNSLAVWRRVRPDLFVGYPDGKIGPNSRHYHFVRRVDAGNGRVIVPRTEV